MGFSWEFGVGSRLKIQIALDKESEWPTCCLQFIQRKVAKLRVKAIDKAKEDKISIRWLRASFCVAFKSIPYPVRIRRKVFHDRHRVRLQFCHSQFWQLYS